MHVGFLNPQGNFDPHDSYWTEHPDFGGQLVYVKSVALALGRMGHRVDILTRQIVDPDWPEFADRFDGYPGAPNVRIVRLPAGPPGFLRKELLWPHLEQEWVHNVLAFYRADGGLPTAMTAHYGDGGLCGALIKDAVNVPFTFTAHSLGAQKMDRLHVTDENLAEFDAHYHFTTRLDAERTAMSESAVNITSTRQERFEQYAHPAYHGAVDVSDDSRFTVIPPGVNLDIFAHGEEDERVQRQVDSCLARDVPPERRDLPVVVASSRIDPKKNLVGLVKAFAHSAQLRELANLVLITGALNDPLRDDAGASPSERAVLQEIRSLVDEHELWSAISAFALRGQPALAAAYRYLARRGSVFALTANYEPFGLAPLEAAAAGLPVAVTQNGGPSESLREDDVEYGVLVDPTDPADIAAALVRLLGNRTEWETFARRGRQRVLDRYTWERTAENYVRVIERIENPNATRKRVE